MKAALSLVLYTTQQLSVSQSDDSFVECKPCKSIVKRDIFVSLQQTLSEWISAVLGSGDIKVKKPRTEIDVNIFFFVITSSYPIQCAYCIISNIPFFEALVWDPFSGLSATTQRRMDCCEQVCLGKSCHKCKLNPYTVMYLHVKFGDFELAKLCNFSQN